MERYIYGPLRPNKQLAYQDQAAMRAAYQTSGDDSLFALALTWHCHSDIIRAWWVETAMDAVGLRRARGVIQFDGHSDGNACGWHLYRTKAEGDLTRILECKGGMDEVLELLASLKALAEASTAKELDRRILRRQAFLSAAANQTAVRAVQDVQAVQAVTAAPPCGKWKRLRPCRAELQGVIDLTGTQQVIDLTGEPAVSTTES